MAKRRDLLALLTPMALMAAKPGELPNVVIDAPNVKTQKAPFGELKIFFDGPTEQLKAMTAGSLLLYAGQTPHPPHTHPEEEFMVITEGAGEIFIDGKTVKVVAGSMMYCAANKSHGIVNTGKKPLLFYFYKWKA
ncbi:MAG: cupin domain-containing protein [Acidobacteria bacterium]|nr:cupin domain-containing protein [Acidobacteriota bacterium]